VNCYLASKVLPCSMSDQGALVILCCPAPHVLVQASVTSLCHPSLPLSVTGPGHQRFQAVRW